MKKVCEWSQKPSITVLYYMMYVAQLFSSMAIFTLNLSIYYCENTLTELDIINVLVLSEKHANGDNTHVNQ